MTVNIDNWKMLYGDDEFLCKAPCTMYGVLFENGVIDDPFYGLNELELTSLSDRDCVFEAEFEADYEMLAREYVELEFYGLDTLCNIILNAKRIGNVKNMHRTTFSI